MNAVRMIQSRFRTRSITFHIVAEEEEAESCRQFMLATSSNVVTISLRRENNLRTRIIEDEFSVAVDCATLHNNFPAAVGVARGPARVLERLSQAIACLVPHRVISSYVRARKDQLPPA